MPFIVRRSDIQPIQYVEGLGLADYQPYWSMKIDKAIRFPERRQALDCIQRLLAGPLRNWSVFLDIMEYPPTDDPIAAYDRAMRGV